ncbi:hypothetical protein [Brevibacterium aurantiacum]|uniref:Uncharacterized protein n=1 Tax=Brevibacterium aurantiacum TaxID=273384 RepID=A0A2A3ZI37_BREAU|nr:hypothetical protein [Brevibacterium aurantiacum]PCC51320.1 hypothetical protein CIK62_02050 [Brevibacterium aurantiacum]
MIFGRWGTFGRFLLLAAAIGMLSGVLWYLALIAVGGWDATADDLRIFPLFAAVGGGLGLVMGVPAYWTVRLCVQWIASRAVCVLFFFTLGAASVVVTLMVVALVYGSGLATLFTVNEAYDLLNLPLFAALGGVLTAATAPLVLRPVPESLHRESGPCADEAAGRNGLEVNG